MKSTFLRVMLCSLSLSLIHGLLLHAQPVLPVHSRWDELTASDWPRALAASSRTCILPIGILEKHGPHVPIGSDLIQVREWAARATKKEYAVVFPDYFYGQINEARHQPEMDSAANESGANQHRLNIPNVYTAIWWYADYPNHYAGEGSKAAKEEGQLVTEHTISQLIEALKAIKADTKTLQLQKEYFDKVRVNP